MALRSFRKIKVGDTEILTAHDVAAPVEHRLDEDKRRERRADNREMKKLRKKVRRRKQHGRQ